jgi:hypothetical protein
MIPKPLFLNALKIFRIQYQLFDSIFRVLPRIRKEARHFRALGFGFRSQQQLKEDIDWYLRDNKHGLYIAQIQAETVDTILWLLWSHDRIDTDALRLSMEAHVANATNVEIPIGLHWQIIQLDQPGWIPDDEAVKALHIDVACEHQMIAKQALKEIYSSKQVHWPLHIRMRAVPLLKDVMNGQVKKDIHHLIGRQASFNDEELGKCRINTWEIKELDFLSPDDYTLRNYIMSLWHPIDPKKTISIQLFISISTVQQWCLHACLLWRQRLGIWCPVY